MTWGAVAVGVGTVAAGALSADASRKAANTQAAGGASAIAEQGRQYDTTRQDLAPYRQAGDASLTRLRSLLGIAGPQRTFRPDVESEIQRRMDTYGHTRSQAENDVMEGWNYRPDVSESTASPSDILAMDPGYKFRLSQGLDATKGNAVARGSLDSGSTLKALTRFGQDYASGEFNNVFNRLSGVAGTGQNAVNQTASAGTNMANNISDTQTGIANARAAGIVGGANAWGGAVSGVNGVYQNNQNNEILKKLLAGNKAGGNTAAYDPSIYAS